MPERIIVVVAMIIAFACLVLVASIQVFLPVFRFPAPGGPHAVGTLSIRWVDAGRAELFGDNPADRREIVAQVWYPTDELQGARHASYLENAAKITEVLARLYHLPPILLRRLGAVRTNAILDAPLSAEKSRYPLLVYLTGLDGTRQISTFQTEELASRGFVVVGLDQPGTVAYARSASGKVIEGRSREIMIPLVEQSVEPERPVPSLLGRTWPEGIVPYLAEDVSFVLDRLATIGATGPAGILAGRLDLDRVGVFGVSLGGMVAAEACAKDTRLKACLIMDVYLPEDVVKAGLSQPTMLITRDADTMRLERRRAGGWTEKDIALTLGTMRSVYERLRGGGYFISIPGIFHLNFTDVPLWSPLLQSAGMIGPIDPRRAYAIINAYSVAFFEKQLQNSREPLLDGPSPLYPELRFEAK